jgi:hypothetical protein
MHAADPGRGVDQPPPAGQFAQALAQILHGDSLAPAAATKRAGQPADAARPASTMAV